MATYVPPVALVYRDDSIPATCERTLVGNVMNGAWDLRDIADPLSPNDFQQGDTALIWQAILECHAGGVAINALSVCERLELNGHLAACGGLQEVVALAMDAIPGRSAESVVRIIKADSHRVRLRKLGTMLMEQTEPGRAILDSAAAEKTVADYLKAVGTAKPDRRNHLAWADLSKDRAPAFEWIWQDWLSWHPTLLAGRGGIGKSLFTQQLATALATCADGMLRPNKPVRVLYWACEDDTDELWRRQERICTSMNMGIADLGDSLTIDARMGLENTLYTLEYGRPMWTPLLGELMQQVNDLAIDVLFLDNVGQIFGANENDRHHVTSFTNGIAGLVRGRKFAPVFLSHPAKASGSEYAGNAAWENAVRMRWLLSDTLPDAPPDEERSSEADQGLRFLCKRKANYSTKDILRMRLENGVLRNTAATVEEYSIGSGETDYLWEKRAERFVLEALDKLSSMGIASSDYKGPAYLPTLVLKYSLTQGLTKHEVERAMVRLQTSGQIKREQVGKYANRSPKFGLVRA